VLEAAGGAVLTLDGAALGYGKAANGFLNPFFVAASGPDLARKAAMHMTKLETFAAAR
jgi:3'-phosphoadenosine 5'-phosphosulfate (PAPS) 3'-phosphatase